MRRHGCRNGEPEMPYAVGDIIDAVLPYGSSEDAVYGTAKTVARVTAIVAPAKAEDIAVPYDDEELRLRIFKEDLSQRRLCEVLPRAPHQWVVFLEPMEKPSDVGVKGVNYEFFPRAMTRPQIESCPQITVQPLTSSGLLYDWISLGRERNDVVNPLPNVMEALRREANVE